MVGEECLQFLDPIEQSQFQWLHDPNKSNEGSLNNIRSTASRYFRKKRKRGST
jgi:hypothetical protein